MQEFFHFVNPSAMQARVRSGGFVLVASQSDKLVGMLEFVPPDHIAMLFVLMRRQAIAKELLARIVNQVRAASPGVSKLTVHSSRSAEPIYRRMRFRQVGTVTTKNGITYIPMELDL